MDATVRGRSPLKDYMRKSMKDERVSELNVIKSLISSKRHYRQGAKMKQAKISTMPFDKSNKVINSIELRY
jgi:hypothetical protein